MAMFIDEHRRMEVNSCVFSFFVRCFSSFTNSAYSGMTSPWSLSV